MITLQLEDRADGDAILLALAILSLERPGWTNYLRSLAERVGASEQPAGGRLFDRFREMNADRTTSELYVALESSVQLQTHYAGLLNMHDGGQRVGFVDAEAWLAKLRGMRD